MQIQEGARGHPEGARRQDDATNPRRQIIDRAEFSDANPVKNGRITIHDGEKKAIFHFRRETRDQARELYEDLMRQMDTG